MFGCAEYRKTLPLFTFFAVKNKNILICLGVSVLSCIRIITTVVEYSFRLQLLKLYLNNVFCARKRFELFAWSLVSSFCKIYAVVILFVLRIFRILQT